MYYSVDIFLFIISEDNELGNVMLPKYSKFYLSREKKRKTMLSSFYSKKRKMEL